MKNRLYWAWSSMIVIRMKDLNKIDFRVKSFPDELEDDESKEKGIKYNLDDYNLEC